MKASLSLQLFVVALLTASSCAEKLEETRASATGSAKKTAASTACFHDAADEEEEVGRAKTAEKGFQIVNGESTSGFAAVGLLIRDIRGKALGGDFEICTGTFVSANTMITAAHCIGPEADGGVAYFPGNTAKISSMTELNEALAKSIKPLHAVYTVDGIVGTNSKTGANEVAQHDIAILIFPAGTAKDTVEIMNQRPRFSRAVTIVGFGKTSLAEDAVLPDTIEKRVGVNKEFFLGPSHAPHSFVLQAAADGSDSQSLGSSGDSGGPLIIDNLLVGVFSTGGINKKTGKGDGLYADLTDPIRGELFEKARAAGALIPLVDPPNSQLATAAVACK